jgi:predicted GH43/DUF377 family glycosyl hydrolase
MKRHGVILAPEGKIGAVFNPAAAKLDDGRFVLLARSVPKGYTKIGAVNQFDDAYTSHLSLWSSSKPDGDFKLVEPFALTPGDGFDKYGVEDPRISKVGDTYYIFYTSIAIGLGQKDASKGIRIAMASTKDFKSFKKHGVVGPDRCSKAGCLIETGGKLWFLWKDEQGVERTMLSPAPKDFEDPAAWKKFWVAHDLEKDQLIGPQANGHEGHGIEPGAPPFAIPEGLLNVYSSISADFKWSISVMLLDKNDPRRIVAKTEGPVLKPETPYELAGDVNNVVFPCGALVEGGRLYVYYGAADTVCAVASEAVDTIKAQLRPFVDRPVRKA